MRLSLFILHSPKGYSISCHTWQRTLSVTKGTTSPIFSHRIKSKAATSWDCEGHTFQLFSYLTLSKRLYRVDNNSVLRSSYLKITPAPISLIQIYHVKSYEDLTQLLSWVRTHQKPYSEVITNRITHKLPSPKTSSSSIISKIFASNLNLLLNKLHNNCSLWIGGVSFELFSLGSAPSLIVFPRH